MNRHTTMALWSALSLPVLTGCGGGGGSDAATTDIIDIPLAITTENAPAVTREVLNSTDTVTPQNTVALLPVGLAVEGTRPVPRINSSALLQRALQPVLSLSPQGLGSVTGISQTASLSCSSGSASVTLTTASSNAEVIGPGDRLELYASHCTLSDDSGGDSLRINGRVTLVLEAPSGFPPREGFPSHDSWSADDLYGMDTQQLQGSFSGFSIQTNGAQNMALFLNGSLRLRTGSDPLAELEYASMNGTLRLSLVDTAQPLDFTLSDVDMEGLVRNEDTPLMFAEMRYNVSYGSRTLGGRGGRISIRTQQPLIHDASTGYPLESGELTISGAAGSWVRVTIPGPNSDLQLAIDANGDGQAEQFRDLSWTDLDAR